MRHPPQITAIIISGCILDNLCVLNCAVYHFFSISFEFYASSFSVKLLFKLLLFYYLAIRFFYPLFFPYQVFFTNSPFVDSFSRHVSKDRQSFVDSLYGVLFCNRLNMNGQKNTNLNLLCQVFQQEDCEIPPITHTCIIWQMNTLFSIIFSSFSQ